MRRRDFLANVLVSAGAFASSGVLAQPAARRGAVVIGVDKAGDLPALKAARSGAASFAAWLGAEGLEVKLLVDDNKQVRAADIFDAISQFVARGTLDQLVVYFAGHGCINSYAEYWLLSQAPDNPNEAVSLTESVELARRSGIPNVIFISDACRSRADSLRAERIRGSLVFPNTSAAGTVRPEIDQFLATLVGDPAWEVGVAESSAAFGGIYTNCFLEAFQRPDQEMVRTVGDKQFVPNRRLKPYLAREVPKRAQAASIRLNQNPDSRIESDENTYIGGIVTTDRALTNESAAPTLLELAGTELARVGAGDLGGRILLSATGTVIGTATAAVDLDRRTGFNKNREAISIARGLSNSLTMRTGFAVTGTHVERVIARARTDVLNSETAGGPSSRIEVDPGPERAASVALIFKGGSGTVVAALDGYIGSIVVDEVGVKSVSYLPSRALRSLSEQEDRRLGELRATVATAAQLGVFRIQGDRETRTRAGRNLADRIRMLKGVDPTLGLYAAYAYTEAGLADGARSVRDYMRGDLGADLFDVAMLAGVLSGKPPGAEKAYPFCPMLSQGWSLLRVRDVRLPEPVNAARDHLRPSLWTTFDSKGMEMVAGPLASGRVR